MTKIMQFIIIIIIYFKAQTLLPQTFGSGSVLAGNTCLMGCLDIYLLLASAYGLLIWLALFELTWYWFIVLCLEDLSGWAIDLVDVELLVEVLISLSSCVFGCSLWLIVSSGWLMWFCVLWVIIFLSMKCIG